MLHKLQCTSKLFLMLLTVVFLICQVQCSKRSVLKNENKRNDTHVLDDSEYNGNRALDRYTKRLTNMIFSGRKGGGGGGGGNGMSMFLMRTLMNMFNATVPTMAVAVMGWMKDIMLMGAGAFMMMMYDMLRKNGDQKKIIIKLPPQPVAPPEPAPPPQTGYGPWEGK